MPPSPEWIAAHAALSSDITRIGKRNGLRFQTMADLVNTDERYPALVPLIIDWVRHVEEKSGLKDPRELANFRDGLYRSLTTIDAMGTDAVPLLMDQYYLDPRLPEVNAYAVGNALRYLAVPSDFDNMAKLGADRSLGSGRAAILEWLVNQGLPEGLQIVVDQLDDPSVRALGIKYIRQFKPLPSGLRPVIEQYLDDSDSEVRKQARATLKRLPK
ncbi:HEAT repeat domain-containing protein [Gordonia oryzae]|uniref:HEAT repeat domain-containing protein n=2 Tax=Gordonia oryzae TaxID=2487349 RepID=A0A3N4G693_9ACTN|nr:HEAT repeat domain-containing protein [Gordonia oryzae]